MSNELMVVDGVFSVVVDSVDAKIVELFLRAKKSDRTKEGYAASVKMLINFVKVGLKDVTLEIALNYADYLKGKYVNDKGEVSKHSVKLHVNVAKSLYSFMVKMNYVNANPFAAVTYDTPAQLSAERILDTFEVQLLLRANVKQRDSLIVKTLYISGVRASELCNLTWGDLSADCVLHIVSGKGDKERYVTLPSEFCKQLRELKGNAENSDPMFKSQKGGHLDESQLHRIVKAVALKAGVNGDVSAHWLRHAHASHSIDNGAKLVTLRDTLGHASLETTNKYLHSKPGESSALSLRF